VNISDLNLDEEAKQFWHQAHIKPEAAVRAAMERGAELGIEMAMKEIKALRRDLAAARALNLGGKTIDITKKSQL
jgi:hypothetical protein